MNEKIQKVAGLVATGKFWKEAIIMTLGMMVAAAAVYYFLVPSKLIIGTVSGLSIVLSGIFETFFGIQIKVSLFVVIINAILLVLAWLLIGEEFGAKTVYTAMILGPLMDFWAWVMPYQSLMEPGTTSVMGDIWFDLCCFVLLLSLSQAILFNINASTGGLDILAKIVNKYLHFDIGSFRVGGRSDDLLHSLRHQSFQDGDHRPDRHVDQRPGRGLLHRQPEQAEKSLCDFQ